MNPIDAQTLRRITSEGSSPRTSSRNSPLSPFTDGGFHGHGINAKILHEPQIPSLDGTTSIYLSGPVFNMGSIDNISRPDPLRPQLALLTDIGRKYPGFPTPLSPTPSAKELFPSPDSPRSVAIRSISPMSMDGSTMCGPSRRCQSHGYEHYASMGLIDNILSPSTRSPSVMSSPRTNMSRFYSPPAIEIANGTETSLTSPLTSTGTILSYTSHRPISSGLLALKPLDEAQTAEYRFWTSCGRRACAFGCGSGNEGERQAGKRLFREADDVDGGACLRGDGEGGDGDVADKKEERKSEWAGRRYVGGGGNGWEGFLKGCEREGVAQF